MNAMILEVYALHAKEIMKSTSSEDAIPTPSVSVSSTDPLTNASGASRPTLSSTASASDPTQVVSMRAGLMNVSSVRSELR